MDWESDSGLEYEHFMRAPPAHARTYVHNTLELERTVADRTWHSTYTYSSLFSLRHPRHDLGGVEGPSANYGSLVSFEIYKIYSGPLAGTGKKLQCTVCKID